MRDSSSGSSISRRSLIALATATASGAALGAMGIAALEAPVRKALAATAQDLQARPCVTVFDESTEVALREVGTVVDLSAIASGEYPSFCF